MLPCASIFQGLFPAVPGGGQVSGAPVAGWLLMAFLRKDLLNSCWIKFKWLPRPTVRISPSPLTCDLRTSLVPLKQWGVENEKERAKNKTALKHYSIKHLRIKSFVLRNTITGKLELFSTDFPLFEVCFAEKVNPFVTISVTIMYSLFGPSYP